MDSTYVTPRAEVDRLTFEDFYAAEFDRVLDSFEFQMTQQEND